MRLFMKQGLIVVGCLSFILSAACSFEKQGVIPETKSAVQPVEQPEKDAPAEKVPSETTPAEKIET